MFQKIRFITETSTLYIATVGIVGYMLFPTPSPTAPLQSAMPPRHTQNNNHTPIPQRRVVISETPLQLELPDYGISLPVDIGKYDPSTQTWTLSNSHVQYADITPAANDDAGNTLIYGHATWPVLGKLAARMPSVGATAIVTTEHYKFTYTFTDAVTIPPTDTSIFSTANSGEPRLTIQTCTGLASEWRTMYHFTFTKVEKLS